MASYRAPSNWEDWAQWLAAGLHGRSRWRLPLLLTGVLLASGRRVVATWIRTAGLSHDFRNLYFLLQSIGRRWRSLGQRVLVLVLQQALANQQRVLLGVDDSPTKRYGPKVQGAGYHHDPTPGPAGGKFCYGHIWVTLAVLVRHPLWGSIGLPICAWLYVRAGDVSKIPDRYRWQFQTKTRQAADLVVQAAKLLQGAGKTVWAVADGFYTKRPFVRPVMAAGVTLVGRLPRNAALRTMPRRGRGRHRGRRRKYGLQAVSLAKRGANRRGWQEMECEVYGVKTVKRIKTFLATHATFGGAIRVVIVEEPTGPQFFYATQTTAGVREIVEAFADRAAIEQVFHDVKEAWGSGQQQVRSLWSSIAAWHLNLWMHTLVELWAWKRPGRSLVRRDDSPWDVRSRRPSHADRRKALQSAVLSGELSAVSGGRRLPRKIRDLFQRLLRIAI